MKCDLCDNKATVYLTQIINGQMTTVNLCNDCATEKEVLNELGFGLADAFLGTGSTTNLPKPEVLACPACGFTVDQLKKIGRMGCPECYHTFQYGLDQMLASMHRGTRHLGKVPKHLPEPPQPELSLDEWREALKKAVEAEAYEEAARIKKTIEALTQAAASQTASEQSN